MKTRSITPVRLRDELEIHDPLQVVSGYLESWRFEDGDASSSFDESDLRLANRGGARISAAEIAATLKRRRAIELALRAIAPDTSLAGTGRLVPWQPLRQLFDAFADIRGIGLSKMTKTLHPKRPALIPMLDSVVQTYLAVDDLGADAPFGERTIALVRGYKRDLDLNRRALRATAGARETRPRPHRGADPRSADLVGTSRRLIGRLALLDRHPLAAVDAGAALQPPDVVQSRIPPAR